MSEGIATAESKQRNLDTILAVLLGIAAIATAFSAYKASLIGDEVISNYNQGIRKVDEASQLYNAGNQFLAEDQAVFLEWIKAVQTDDIELADYIQTNLMSGDLSIAVDWWAENSDEATPFIDNPEYNLVQYDDAAALDAEVEEHFAAASKADEESDRFEFVTVLLAVALFFLGLASVVKRSQLQFGVLVGGGVLLAASLVFLTTLLI